MAKFSGKLRDYFPVSSPQFVRAMTSRRSFLLGATATVSCIQRRATAFPGYAFIATAGERSVTVVDLSSFSVRRQIRLDATPSITMAHPERPVVYVLSPDAAMVYEIDAADIQVKRKLSLRGTPVTMRLASGGRSLWVLCRSPHSLVCVDLDRWEAVSHPALPAAPEEFDLSPDGRMAAASFLELQTVGIVDLEKSTPARMIAAGDDARGVLFRADGRQLLIANRRQRLLSIADVNAGELLVRLPLPVEPENLCVKANGGQVFITGKGMDAVVVVHPYQTEVWETVLAGKAPGPMAISPLPEYLFTANTESGDVTVLEVETRNVL